jgi:hypothetical protein
MAIVKVLGQDNVIYDTESNHLFDVGRGNYRDVLLNYTGDELYAVSEKLGHPIVKVDWSFHTSSKEWKPWSSHETNKEGDTSIYEGYDDVLAYITTERPLWNSKPEPSVLAELEAKAYELEAQLRLERGENKRKVQEAHALLHSLLTPGAQMTLVSFKEYLEDYPGTEGQKAEMVIRIGDYELTIEPMPEYYGNAGSFEIKVNKINEE